MLILGMDTTAVTASVAIVEIDEKVRTYSLFSVKNRLTHSETLMPMVKQALDLYGAKPSDLNLIAVSVGPGSFTGVRIGVATVKGLAFGLGKEMPCAAVSTLEALAENLSQQGGIVCPVMDARRSQFYNALFQDRQRLRKDRLIRAEELKEELLSFGGPVTLCGDGADLFYALCGELPNIKLASAASKDQNALSVAVCGYRAFKENRLLTAKELKPVYLRASQAEREKFGIE
ncbi:MAG TPA: tRNA (adenosine(37)-N6)-threonylcarbamoyltransferase complex dimerization subunit type 1 TsaB [Bacillota bacterium]|nr:tRNA (adenosine(37)-N6)-threonylcarbamoyltransferase complex dimerization subunit type 1 TsaB [Bacillota bacterium]HOK68028.1 tRNA (adenosine(37)-N6)-threonylcarbamoyltransferase complex dimerization subunit type 1 TsaB [Bacillota bacterium]HPP84574.1 tRNA (adenosine(37)-N6)-threonylcarbamoyltransferase complex dimerization subunit type 1 TsaB [Bacillota bacterium]